MIAGPLYDLTKKGRAFEWREEQQEAFDTMKIALMTPPIIRNPVYGNVKRPLIVTVDASPIGVGGVLGQLDENNKRYVIRYESHRFNVTGKEISPDKTRTIWSIFDSQEIASISIWNILCIRNRCATYDRIIKQARFT